MINRRKERKKKGKNKSLVGIRFLWIDEQPPSPTCVAFSNHRTDVSFLLDQIGGSSADDLIAFQHLFIAMILTFKVNTRFAKT